MNKIICYSAMHTGTWFLIKLLETSVPKWTDIAGDANMSSRGRKYRLEELPIEDINEGWYKKNIEQYLTDNEKQNDLIIIHGHHFSLISKLSKTIIEKNIQIPIVTPIRNPLQAIVSLCWRRYKTYENFINNSSEEERISRADIQIERIKQFIKLPSNKIHLFPIDIFDNEDDKQTLRHKQTKQLFKFCRLDFTNKTEEYISRWELVNSTKNWTLPNKGMLTPPKDAIFMKINRILKSNDSSSIKQFIDIEYERAQEDTELKELLKQIGYKHMGWW